MLLSSSPGEAVAELHAAVRGGRRDGREVVAGEQRAAQDRQVVHGRVRERPAGAVRERADAADLGRVVAVPLAGLVARGGAEGGAAVLVEEGHDAEQELVAARVALVEVEVVVADEEGRQVRSVDRPAEPLDAVVEVHVDLDEVEHRAVADAGERDAVQLVALADLVAGVAHRDVLDRARAVVRQQAAVGRVRDREARNREPLDRALALEREAAAVVEVGRRVAEHHETAPQRDVAACPPCRAARAAPWSACRRGRASPAFQGVGAGRAGRRPCRRRCRRRCCRSPPWS